MSGEETSARRSTISFISPCAFSSASSRRCLTTTACTASPRLLGWLAYKVDKRHRLVASITCKKRFPGKYTDTEIDTIVRRVYLHFCTLLVEIMHMPRRYHLHNYKRLVVLREPTGCLELLLSGRPVLFVTGHFGNWEAAGYVIGMFGFKPHAIARPLDNPYLDDFLRSFRERTGQKLLAKHGDFDQMEKLLRRGGPARHAGGSRRGAARPVRRFLRPARLHAQGGRPDGAGAQGADGGLPARRP